MEYPPPHWECLDEAGFPGASFREDEEIPLGVECAVLMSGLSATAFRFVIGGSSQIVTRVALGKLLGKDYDGKCS